MTKYSLFNLVRQGLSTQPDWPAVWRHPDPKSSYDVIIIGGGGHGLATAYFLAKNHGITDIAVLERGYLGSGNVGRNTMAIRSDYVLEPNAHFFKFSMQLWEELSSELNYNIMWSQRGIIYLLHSYFEIEMLTNVLNLMHLNGNDVRMITVDEIKEMEPNLDCSPDAHFPIVGGALQVKGGPARHDAVAWGFARAANQLGVDLIQNCEVTDILRQNGKVTGVKTSRGTIHADRVALAVAGNSGVVAKMAGFRLPIETHLLQACVTEPVKPFMKTMLGSGLMHVYMTQTAKGEIVIGGPLDGYNSYTQRGDLRTIEQILASATELFPGLSRLKLMRAWAGRMDMTMDGSPIISKTPIQGLFFNGGWCYGGFKATPASGYAYAYTIANDKPHALNEDYTLERFDGGRVLDEKAKGPHPKDH